MEFWNIEAITGYKPISTFWEDFCIAEKFGIDAIKDTFKRVSKEWKHDYKMITELTMVMNHKCWHFYHLGNMEYSKLYTAYYYELDEWCGKHLKGKELEYYYQTTD